MTDEFPFRFYHPDRPTGKTRCNLPHWDQGKVCYFITFHTADAMPRAAREKWERQRTQWLFERGLPVDATNEELRAKLKPHEQRSILRYCSKRYEKSLDAQLGACALGNTEISRIVSDGFAYLARESVCLGDYVIMPNHVHALLQPRTDETLKPLMDRFRKYTGRMINRELERTGRFWARDCFDHIVRSRHFFRRYQQYIRLNPRRAGLQPGEYVLFESGY